MEFTPEQALVIIDLVLKNSLTVVGALVTFVGAVIALAVWIAKMWSGRLHKMLKQQLETQQELHSQQLESARLKEELINAKLNDLQAALDAANAREDDAEPMVALPGPAASKPAAYGDGADPAPQQDNNKASMPADESQPHIITDSLSDLILDLVTDIRIANSSAEKTDADKHGSRLSGRTIHQPDGSARKFHLLTLSGGIDSGIAKKSD